MRARPKTTRIALAAAAVALAAAWPAGALAAKEKGPLDVATSLSPGWSYFGDTVTARLDVVFDPSLVEASTVVPAPAFGDWQQLSATRFAKTRSGALVHETWWYRLDCLTFACLPRGPIVQKFTLPKATIKAQGTDGRPVVVEQAWPPVRVSARFLPPALPTARPVFRLQTAVPAPSYSIRPSLLALLLDVAGGLLLAGAAAAVGFVLWRRVAARRRSVERPPLQRALALVRDAKGREPDDRRRAVGLLARTLPSHDRFVVSASELAWSADEPSPAGLEELAETIEADLGNGERT